VLGAPGGEGVALARAGLRREALGRRAQLGDAPGDDLAVVHAMRVEAAFGQHRRREPARVHERLQRHHQRAARERGHALVRRVARPDRRRGQQLPDRLAGRDEPVDELEGRGTEVADAVRAGQGGGVQQHAGGALLEVHGM